MLSHFLHTIRPTRRELLTSVMVALMLVVTVGATLAQTATPAPTNTPVPPTSIPTITVDPAPLFDSISTYVPMFFGILAVAGGILIGKRIAEYVIKAIADAF